MTLAALVTFLPGMTLTIGMRELATGHLQSGVADTASALVQLLGLVFGVEIGRSIALNWCAATVLALLAYEAGEALFGLEAAAFVALAIGIAGNLAGARLRPRRFSRIVLPRRFTGLDSTG